MEIRDTKINFNKSGSGSYSSRIVLPADWVRQMKLDINNKEIELKFDGENIVISKKKN